MQYTRPLARLIEEFQKLPGIGPRSAQRMAFHMLKMPLEEVKQFSSAILEAKEKIKYCRTCFNMSSLDPCEICQNAGRDRVTVCVVAESKDVIAIERTKEFKGTYHVLQGLISPLDGISPEDLRIKELLSRVSDETPQEIILAINPSIEGEATSMYLSKIIRPFGVKISRIAFGIPIGSDLEYADEMTLAKAIECRQTI